MRDWVAGMLVAVEEADSVDCGSVEVCHSDEMIWYLLRTEIDQHRTFPRHHVQVCSSDEQQGCRERKSRSIVVSRVGKLHQAGPKSM